MDIAIDMIPQLTAEQKDELGRTVQSERLRFGGDHSRYNVADRIESAIRQRG
jgi:hypothetical protein